MNGAFLLAFALAGCVPVEGDKITARDLAEAVPAFSILSGDTVVGLAPAPGARRIFRAAELRRLAAKHGLTLEAAGETCAERPMVELDRARVLAAMRSSLDDPEASIELVELVEFRVPRGEIEFPLGGLRKPPSRQPDAAVLWSGSVRYGEGRRYPVWARVRVNRPPREVEPTSGRATIVLSGRALSGGSRGDSVMVRNPLSGKSFRARVSGKGTVAVGGAEGESK
jgi:hypothetical protein